MRLLEDGISALNQMACAGSFPADALPSQAQRSAVIGLHKHFCLVASYPVEGSPQRAFHQLLRAKGRYSATSAGSAGMPATYKQGKIKLPKCGAGHTPLVDVLDEPYRGMLVSGQGILKTQELDSTAVHRPVFDPVLRRQPRTYGALLGDLHAAGVVEIGPGPPGAVVCFLLHVKTNIFV